MVVTRDSRPAADRHDPASHFSPYRHPEHFPPEPHGPVSVVRALFELNGDQRMSMGLARAIYAVVVVGTVVTWVAMVILGFSQGITLGILALLLGWIPAVLWIACARIILEFSTAMDTLIGRTPGGSAAH
ncbi:DUF4282 domain-containing protein [Cellulosimicrobium funkei]|nr:DUF4282 domain-containing protein [Cellulosimicrobium funkei]